MNKVLEVLVAIYDEINGFVGNIQRLSTFEKYIFLLASFLGFQSYGGFLKSLVHSLSSSLFTTMNGWQDLDFFFTLILIVLPLGAFLLLKYLEQLEEENSIDMRETRDWMTRTFPLLNSLRWKVAVEWPECWEAANTMVVVFRVKGIQASTLKVDVWQGTDHLQVSYQFVDERLHVLFPARNAGKYRFILTVSGRRLPVWERHVLPGMPSQKNCFIHGIGSSTVVVASGSTFTASLQVQDSFHNVVDCHGADCDDVSVELGRDISSITVGVNPTSPGLLLSVKMGVGVSGAYKAVVKYRGELVKGGNIAVLVLMPEQERAVAKNVEKIKSGFWFSGGTYFRVTLVRLNGKDVKPKEVYVYVTEKQIYMKEYYLKLLNSRVLDGSFRICPAVNLAVKDETQLVISQREAENNETLVESDSVLLLAATYYTILQSRTGGSHTFEEKRHFFYTSLAKYHEQHMKHKHSRLSISVNRNDILKSTLQATKHFSAAYWARLFEVHFQGEVGIDQGGVRREYFDILSRFIFDPKNGMFVPLDSDADPGCPVHLNPNPPPHIKPKHYTLAGLVVGKCLYESAMGSTYRQNLNAKLSTSLLAKMIGVDCHYSMLEKDAPKLWISKIKKIIETESMEKFVEDLGEKLTFTEEEYDDKSAPRVVELVVGGADKIVTDENKMDYIAALGSYLQTKRVSRKMEAFLDGVHTLVPDTHLAMWDEGELELLLCGVRDYNVEQMRGNSTVESSRASRFHIVLEWFWIAVTHMTQEDLSRLVQFCTGSSLLPPGGFKDLEPKLQLSWGGLDPGSLPVSHTCFNNLVLPDAKSYQELERVLLIAIREGSEGFLIA